MKNIKALFLDLGGTFREVFRGVIESDLHPVSSFCLQDPSIGNGQAGRILAGLRLISRAICRLLPLAAFCLGILVLTLGGLGLALVQICALGDCFRLLKAAGVLGGFRLQRLQRGLGGSFF